MTLPGLTRIVPLLAVILALIALHPAPAMAQPADSAAALRRENDQLRERLSQLEARIKQLERENEALKLEIQRLRDAGVPVKPGAPPIPGLVPTTTDVIAPQSQQPLASPDALLVALQGSYAEQFGDRPIEDDGKGDRIQEVRRWTREAERSFRGNIEWVIRIDKENLPAAATDPIPFWIIDAESGKLLHAKPVKATIPTRFAVRILENTDTPVWDLRGALTARPTVNADRPDEGLLNFPPFIGPFAEFGYDLSIRNAAPHEDQK